MRIKMAMSGNLDKYMEDEYKKAATAVSAGITEATNGLKLRMRQQVRSAGLSSRLANTWRGDIYPKGKKSISAAGVIYTNAQKIMENFEYQTVIRGKNGFWLAIPTEAIPKRAKGKRITPGLYEQMKGIKLRFVYRAHGTSLLVHEQRKKTIIAFLLVPQVKMPKLLNFEKEGKNWQEQLPELILKNWRD